MTNTSVNKNDLKMYVLGLANYQEQLLQNYRIIFLTSQAIVISMATLLASLGSLFSLMFFGLLLVIGLKLLKYWTGITKARELDVSYFHLQLRKIEKTTDIKKFDNKPWVSFKKWQEKTLEEKKNEFLKDKDLLRSTTREIMGKELPKIFKNIWIIAMILAIVNFIVNNISVIMTTYNCIVNNLN